MAVSTGSSILSVRTVALSVSVSVSVSARRSRNGILQFAVMPSSRLGRCRSRGNLSRDPSIRSRVAPIRSAIFRF